MNAKTEIIEPKGKGLAVAESKNGRYALGLNPDKFRPCASLGASARLLDMSKAKQRVQSKSFQFGRAHFDGSWTKDQNGWGKCASSAATYGAEKATYMKTGKKIELADDHLYGRCNGGKDAGGTLSENREELMTGGVASRHMVKPGDIYRKRKNFAAADKDGLRFRAYECLTVSTEQEMVTALCNKKPVIIAIHVGRNWQKFGPGNVLVGDKGMGNHSEHVDDIRYNAKTGRFEFRKHSSHGVSYGEDGFCWIHWDHIGSVHSSHQPYCVDTMIDDPLADTPFGRGEQDFDDSPMETPVLTVTSNAKSCHWCQKWDDEVREHVVAAGIQIKKGRLPGSGIPRFQLNVGGKKVDHRGYWSMREIQQEIANLQVAAMI